MARILVVYHRPPGGQWRSTYDSHLRSLERFSGHECIYLNTARKRIPDYIRSFVPDAVIFHYTFLATRTRPNVHAEQVERIGFLKDLACPKALIPHDEQARSDLLCRFALDFGVTHVFTPASEPQWPQIYDGLDFSAVRFTTVLTGYVDEESVSRTARRSLQLDRPVDVGYRSWSIQYYYGRHGLLKRRIGEIVAERAPDYGLVTDISSDVRDAFLGDSWFDFLLKCKYTLGVEGGTSILDRDGSIAERTVEYVAEHPEATFAEVEAACFPGIDGSFDYRLLGPRHLEAVMTRTCQVLIEGSYGGTLEAGLHYIPVKPDFSDLDEALQTVRNDQKRAEMVERAYRDVIESGRWTYRVFSDMVIGGMLGEDQAHAVVAPAHRVTATMRWNRFDDTASRWATGDIARLARWYASVKNRWHQIQVRVWFEGPLGRGWYRFKEFVSRPPRQILLDALVSAMGEERLWWTTVAIGNVARRLRGRETIPRSAYVPSEAELARRERAAEARKIRDAEKD